MVEWSKESKYNSFNSYKGLCYYPQYKDIEKWWGKREDALQYPPIECSLDPIAECNLRCYYCNSQRYLRESPDEIPKERRIMTRKYMESLIDFLSDWGVKGVCLGGGGESMLNKGAWQLPSHIAAKGMQCAIVTNGTILNSTIASEMLYCRWVGFSVDASDEEVYEKIKGVKLFKQVIDNIQTVVKLRQDKGSPVSLAYKFLILPENQAYIYEACQLAKEIGVDDFHVRPCDFERKDYKGEPFDFDLDTIWKQFELCHKLEDKNFHVYTVQHKYNEVFRVKHDFNHCYAAPLVIQCCTDGYVYACVDHRIEKRFRLGSHYPEPKKITEWWGKDAHLAILKSINPQKECSRCTWSEYNRQVEEVGIEDRMCIRFP